MLESRKSFFQSKVSVKRETNHHVLVFDPFKDYLRVGRIMTSENTLIQGCLCVKELSLQYQKEEFL